MGNLGNFAGRFLKLKMWAGENYPAEPPTVKFINKVNIPGVVGSDGTVEVSELSNVTPWDPTLHDLRKVLQGIANKVQENANQEQPDAEAVYE